MGQGVTGLGKAGAPAGDVLTVQGVAGGTPLPVSSTTETPPATATNTTVAYSVVSVVLAAANANRKHLRIYNNSTAVLWIVEGAAAVVGGAGAFPLLPASAVGAIGAAGAPGGVFTKDFPVGTEVVNGIWEAAGAGSALVSEETP